MTDILEKIRSNSLKKALNLAGLKYAVFPLLPDSKAPQTEHGFHEATTDEAQIKRWFENSQCNLGIACKDGLAMVDLDRKHGKDGLKVWLDLCSHNNQPALPDGRITENQVSVKTPNNGFQIYFQDEKQVIGKTESKIGEGIDTRGLNKGYAVAPPSRISEGTFDYVWIIPPWQGILPNVPEWLIRHYQACTAKKSPPKKIANLTDGVMSLPVSAYVQKALSDEIDKVRDSSDGTRNATLNEAAFAIGTLLGAEWTGLQDSRIKLETLLREAAQQCGLPDNETLSTIASGLNAGILNPRPKPEGYKKMSVKPRKLLTEDYSRLLTDWGYNLRCNILTDDIELNGQLLTDALEAGLTAEFRDYGIRNNLTVSIDHAREAMLIEAAKNAYNPIKDYLNALNPVYNGAIAKLAEYFQDNDLMAARWIEHFLVGSVARIFEGYQNPVLVLDGLQDLGKSHFAKWLCPLKDRHYEGAINPESRDCKIRLADVWIWEIMELGSTTRKADVDALKALLTLGQVRDRKPYGRRDIVKPVVTSFIGTLNNSCGFLIDSTGNRRFHVLGLKSINWNYVTIDVKDVWAEAVAKYKAGHWRLTEADKLCRDTINQEYEITDPIEITLSELYEATKEFQDRVTSFDVLQAVKKHTNLNDTAVAMKISDIMKKWGATTHRERSGGGNPQKVYRGVKTIPAYQNLESSSY